MSTKVPSDPNLTPEMRRFLDDRARAEKTLEESIVAALAAIPAFASQAEAEAGALNTVTMSPLRTAQWYTANKPKLIHVRHVLSSGTAGGGSSTGSFNTLTLNTTVINEITGASLSSNQVTGLPTGNYYFQAEKVFFNTGQTQIKLFDVTSTADILIGMNISSTGANNAFMTTVSGPFTLSQTTAVDLRYRCSNTQNTNGLGIATSWGSEIYCDLKIWKI